MRVVTGAEELAHLDGIDRSSSTASVIRSTTSGSSGVRKYRSSIPNSE